MLGDAINFKEEEEEDFHRFNPLPLHRPILHLSGE
jgi:hypothetical protein